MASVEELRVVRLYRAYNTAIQLCMDRGYVVRHPSVVAAATRDPKLFSPEDGLDYDWFLRHFVVQDAEGTTGGNGLRGKSENDDKTTNSGWVPMRNAMRLVCTAAQISDAAQSHSSPRDEDEEKVEPRPSTSEKGSSILVFFVGNPLTTAELYELRTKALQKKAQSMIVVSAVKIAPVVRREARELGGRLRPGTREELLSVQLFDEDALAFNIARHETVPPHEPLTHDATQAFLQRKHMTLSQLPRILESDPMVAYLGLSRGSVVQIRRHTKESGPYEMYRQVI